MTTNVTKKLSKDERKTILSKPLFYIDIKSEEGNRGIFGIKHVKRRKIQQKHQSQHKLLLLISLICRLVLVPRTNW